MPQRRTRKGGQSADARTKDMEMRQNKLYLFIQQFEKEAHYRIIEMERKMEDMLASADRVFKVELLKMPPSLQNTRLADLTSEVSAGDVTIAMKTECPEIHQPLTRTSSKRAKQSDGTPNQVTQTQKKTTAKTSKGGKGAKRTRTLVASNSTGSLGCTSTTMAKRTGSRLVKISDHTMLAIPKPRSMLLSASEDDLSCSAAGSAHITVTTSHGEMVSFSEETKNDINLDLLDDVALHQIQRLMKLMNYLFSKAKIAPSEG